MILADVLFHPIARNQRLIATQVQAAVNSIPFVAAGGRLANDVEQAGELLPHPLNDPILIVNIIDP